MNLYSDPPDPVTDLTVIETRWRQLKIQWTAPVSTEPVVGYEIRCSTIKVISNDTDWNTNSSESNYPYRVTINTSEPQGRTTTYLYTNLDNTRTYFFAIKSTTDTSNAIMSSIDSTANRPYGQPSNTAPSGFSLTYPTYGTKVLNKTPGFDWADAVDIDIPYGDEIKYEMYLSTLSSTLFDGTPPSLTGANVVGNITTSYLVLTSISLTDNVTYYWRVKATDKDGQTSWSYNNSDKSKFVVNHTSDPPTVPSLLIPVISSAVIIGSGLFFDWSEVTDADPDDIITFRIYLSTISASYSPGFSTQCAVTWSSYTLTSPSQGWIENATYWWFVRAIDLGNLYSQSATNYFIVNDVNDPPTENYLISPGTSVIFQPITILRTLKPTFYWTFSSDPDPYSNVWYQIFVSSYSLEPETGNEYYSSTSLFTTYYYDNNLTLEEETTYYWRVRIWDLPFSGSAVYSSNVNYFFTSAINDQPNPSVLLKPENNSTTSYFYPKFEWTPGYDTGFESGISSQTLIYWTTNSTKTIFGLSKSASSYIPTEPLINNATYYWKIIIYDNGMPGEVQLSSESSVNKFILKNSSPNVFNLTSPLSGTIVKTSFVQVYWDSSTDIDNEIVKYRLEYSTYSDFSVYITSSGLLFPGQPNYTIFNVLDNTTYYWRVISYDIWGHQRVSNTTNYFVVDNIPQNPNPFDLISPENKQVLSNTYTTFYWEQTYDIDPFDSILKYRIYISTAQDFSSIKFSTETGFTKYYLPRGILEINTTYYWYVVAISSRSGQTVSTSSRTFFIENVAPVIPLLIFPKNDVIVTTSTIALSWIPSFDYQNDNFYYELHITSQNWSVEEVFILPQTQNWYNINLADDTTYQWYVIVTDTYTNSSQSEIFTFWTSYQNIPPTIPVILDPKDKVISLPYEFKWTTSTDSDIFDSVRYKVIITTSADLSVPVIISSYSIPNFLLDNYSLSLTTYYWQVISFDKTFSQTTSQITTFILSEYKTVLLTPQDNEQIIQLPINFNFTKVEPLVIGDTMTYTVVYSSKQNFIPKTEVILNTTSYSITTPLSPGTTYFWYVKVEDGFSRKSVSETYQFITPYKIPPVPSVVEVSAETNGIRIFWSKVTTYNDGSLLHDFLCYKVYRTNNFFVNSGQLIAITTNAYFIDSVDPASDYFYGVRTVNIWGVESLSNNWVRIFNYSESKVFITDDKSVMVTIPEQENIHNVTITELVSEETETFPKVYEIVATKNMADNFIEISFSKPENINYYQLQYYDGYNWIDIPSKELSNRIIVTTQYFGKYRISALGSVPEDGLTIIGCSPKKKIITPNNDGQNDIIEFIYKPGTYLTGEIYNIKGEKICDLLRKQNNLLYFDGRNNDGKYLPPGVYVYTITSTSDEKTFNGTVIIKY